MSAVVILLDVLKQKKEKPEEISGFHQMTVAIVVALMWQTGERNQRLSGGEKHNTGTLIKMPHTPGQKGPREESP